MQARSSPHSSLLTPQVFGRRWTRADYTTGSVTLARRLLGRLLIRVLDGETLAGRIVETEAYRGVIDAASHAYRGRRTPRNEAMYAHPGTSYVYFTYGMHYCMNVVCGSEGDPQAVLLRALEPLAGLETMRMLRAVHPGKSARAPRRPTDHELCSGPARLCQALAIDRKLNGVDMTSSDVIYIAEHGPELSPIRPRDIHRCPRIGIGYSGEWAEKPLRFLVEPSRHVSVPPARKPPARSMRIPSPGR